MKVGEHLGHEIKLSTDKRFEVHGPLFTNEGSYVGRTFDTWNDAVEGINRRAKTKAKSEQRKLALDVLLESSGRPATIKGIHARLANVLFTDSKIDVGPISTVFPDVPWIRAAMQEMKELRMKLVALDKSIRPYGIKVSRGYNVNSPEKLDELVNLLVAEHEEKTKDAAAKGDSPLKLVETR